MDTTYSWHPGVVRVTPTWAIPVPLLPDEIFSSWIVRASLAHGCAPLVFTGEVWPGWRLWTCDLDRQLSVERLQRISSMSGIASSSFSRATLVPIAAKVSAQELPEKGLWPWITALGARNRKRRGGMQYCPACLNADNQPHFRIQWRFSWHTTCAIHKFQLFDRCPSCGCPLEPHRALPEHGSIAVCPSCGVDLRCHAQSIAQPDALKFQLLADEAVLQGTGLLGEQQFPVAVWMEVAHFYAVMLRRFIRSPSPAVASFLKNAGLKITSECRLDSLALELLSIEERIILLGDVGRLMTMPLMQIAELMELTGISRQGACPKDCRIPSLIRENMEKLKDAARIEPRGKKSGVITDAWQPRSRQEVNRMMAVLRRRMAMKRP